MEECCFYETVQLAIVKTEDLTKNEKLVDYQVY